ncbi:ABC transporter ATP-binding protein [Baekduia sp.]|uniref:ABC transporter ATP-binding protein n=1 Tax=Baekduia sp. TaxID=2600305 RepID=UPI002E04EAAE|nr:ATP-binding cassette domain-containing protein [Baekduia sp.]
MVQTPRDVEGDVLLEGVTRRFGAVVALQDVTLRVAPREVVAVVGPSGCGKSTLLELVCGLQRVDAGTLTAGRAVLMPQRDLLLPWLDARDNAALPLRLAGTGKDAARAEAHTLLAELGLDGFERSRTWELSGGMRQRVAVARTLLSGAPILCLDEPFGALDAITRADAQAWLASILDRTPRTVLLVTHDVEEAAVLADRVIVLSPRPGHVVADLQVGVPRGPAGRSPTDPQIVAVRARALEALRGAMA